MWTMQYILIVSFIHLGVIGLTSAVLCTTETSDGHRRYRYCREKCCEITDDGYPDVCCYHKRGNEVYIGTGMVTLVLVVVFTLCFTYVCCKKKLLRISRQAEARNRNTRLVGNIGSSSRRVDTLPSVSGQVVLEPPVPPPYELLPPPYYKVEPNDQSKKNDQNSWPDVPPPAYSQNDPNDS